MDLLGSAINALVVAVVGLVLWVSITGRLKAQDARMDRLERRIDELAASTGERFTLLEEKLTVRIDRLEESLNGRMDRLEESLNGRMDRLEESVNIRIDALRSDLTQVALAVGAHPRSEPG